jgi:hypothetical protein
MVAVAKTMASSIRKAPTQDLGRRPGSVDDRASDIGAFSVVFTIDVEDIL